MLIDNYLFMKKKTICLAFPTTDIVLMFTHSMLTHKICKILATCMNYYQLINLYALRTFCFEKNRQFVKVTM